MFWENFITWSKDLIVNFSYAAIFFVSFIGTSTIFIPFPIYLVIFFASGLGLNPMLVGIVAGLGSAVGELTGYLIGAGGRQVAEVKKKVPKIVWFFTRLFKKFGFAVIVITSFLPFPFDFVGILSGMSNYDIKKFFIAVFIGKAIKCLVVAYSGYLVIPYVMDWMGLM